MTAVRYPQQIATAEHHSNLDTFEKSVFDIFGPVYKLKDENGELLGPLGPLSYTPQTFMPFLQFAQGIGKLPLSAIERELAILATCSVTKCAWVTYAHKKIGTGVGLKQEQVESAANGKCPEGLDDRQKAVFEAALKMIKNWGRIDDGVFDEAVNVLERESVSAVSQVVGMYAMSSIMITAAAVPVPKHD